MSNVEMLKQRIHQAVEENTSEELLQYVDSLLTQEAPIATENEEHRIELGMADMAAGRVISLEDFLKENQAERQRWSESGL